MKKNRTFSFLRIVAVIVLLSGAAGSLYFVLDKGSNNKSILLRALFVIWVLSPFAAFLTADAICKRRAFFARKALYWMMLVVTPGSLVSYSGTFNTLLTKPAFIFLVVPLISWLLMLIVILVVRKQNARRAEPY